MGISSSEQIGLKPGVCTSTTRPTTPFVGQTIYETDTNLVRVWSGSAWNTIANGGTSPYQYQSTLYYTTVGTATFTKASYPWLRAIRVKCQGGGGGGAGCSTSVSGQIVCGKAGTGGVYAESFITNISGLAASVTVTVGAGGNGGAAGTNAGSAGGTSSFGSLVSATGGNGGGTADYTFPPNFPAGPVAGPTTGTGDLVIPGGDSTAAISLSTGWVMSGSGGASFMAPNGTAGAPLVSGVNNGANGSAGTNYGGGGTAGGNTQNIATARSGGNGAQGIVIVELYA